MPIRSNCSAQACLDLITPKKKITRQKNIAYGQLSRQCLDVYFPKKNVPSTLSNTTHNVLKPVIIFSHGGSWTHGSKENYYFFAESFVRAGFIVVIYNYHLAPEHVYPVYVEDTASAIAWVYRHIIDFGGCPERLVLLGHSAGAFNMVEVAVNARYLNAVNVPIHAIKAVIGLAGPYDYEFKEEPSKNAFPDSMTRAEVMPVNHIQPDSPPHLLLVAEKDNLVKTHNGISLSQALQHAGVPVELEVIKGAGHIDILASVATRLVWLRNTRAVILDYLQRTLVLNSL